MEEKKEYISILQDDENYLCKIYSNYKYITPFLYIEIITFYFITTFQVMELSLTDYRMLVYCTEGLKAMP